MRAKIINNKKLVIGVTSAILIVSIGVDKGISSKLTNITEIEQSIKTESKAINEELKLWKNNELWLGYIKDNYPIKDGEQSLLNFLDHLVFCGRFNEVDILDMKVNIESLFSETDLVNTEIQVKLRGTTDRVKEFTSMSREIDFVNIKSIKSVYNRSLNTNDTIVNYMVTGRYSKPNMKIKNPKDLINMNTILSNITGEWVDYSVYKKQIKELETIGEIITEGNPNNSGGNNTTGQSEIEDSSLNSSVELELEGFEEVSNDNEVNNTIQQDKPIQNNRPSGNTSSKPTNNKPKEDIIKEEPFVNPLDIMKVIKEFSNEHQGIALEVKSGTDVKSVASGKVIHSGELGEFGNVVMVEHKNGEISMYGNLSTINVKVGDKIKQKHIVGKSGKYGSSEQLYFSFAKGDFVNPLEFFKVDKK